MKYVSKLILVLAVFTLLPASILAQEAGKIRGKVTDAETGEALIGANVVIQGTTKGASTNIDGEYIILNVSPGTVTLEARYIGYANVVVENVKISTGRTTVRNFELKPQSYEGEEVVVTAEQKLVVKDRTSSSSKVSSEEIENLPVQELNQIVEVQAGVTTGSDGQIHIRGGRSSEVSYIVDGIRVTDNYDQSQGARVENQSVQELEVISGTFNAEYGQAMSGIVKIITKSGGNKYKGNLRVWSGQYATPEEALFSGVANTYPVVDGIDQYNFQGNFSGPIINDKLTFYVSGRRFVNKGWLYGYNAYSPHGPLLPTTNDAGEEVFEEGFTSVPLDNPVNKFGERIDPNDPWISIEDTTNGRVHYIDDGTRDSSLVSMNRFETYSGQANLQFKPISELKFNLIGSYGFETGKNYSHQDKLVPKGQPDWNSESYNVNLKTTITPSQRTYLVMNAATKYNGYEQSLYDDPFDSRYFNYARLGQLPSQFATGQNGQFNMVGTNNQFIDRSTRSYIGKIEISSQVTDRHFIKAGAEIQGDIIKYDEFSLQEAENSPTVNAPEGVELGVPDESTPDHIKFTRRPVIGAAFIQDKIEYDNLIINAGLRLDYFRPNGQIPKNTENPELLKRPGERSGDVWEDADDKVQLSPRLGVAYPISEEGVIHFSYGYFFQIPSYQRLFYRDEVILTQSSGTYGIFGNPDLKPQRTIQYEIGLQQQLMPGFAINVTGYYRDIRDWVSSGPTYPTANPTIRYGTWVNRDFAISKGITFSAQYAVNRQLQLSADYTFSVAEGTNSDPAAEFFQAVSRGDTAGVGITKFLTPLDWDRRHVLNGSAYYTGDNWGGSILAKFRTGTPYTPDTSIPDDVGINASTDVLTNSLVKPSQFTIDLNLYKNFMISGQTLKLFMNVYNLLDAQNVSNVYADSGDPDQPLRFPANFDEGFYDNPTFFNEPRRIQVGIEFQI